MDLLCSSHLKYPINVPISIMPFIFLLPYTSSLKNKTLKSCPCPGNPPAGEADSSRDPDATEIHKIHLQASAATPSPQSPCHPFFSLGTSLSGASQSCAKIICLGLQFDQSENSVLTGSVMIKDGCAHVNQQRQLTFLFSSSSPGPCGGRRGTRTKVGPDPPRSESNCLLRVQEVGKIWESLFLWTRGPLFLTASWSATAFFLRTWGDSDLRVLRLCSLYPSGSYILSGEGFHRGALG